MGRRKLSKRSTVPPRYCLRSGTRQTSDTRGSSSLVSKNTVLNDAERYYLHKPLDTTKNEIRLLKLDSILPATLAEEDPAGSQRAPKVIHGSIRHVSLDEAGKYVALSYTWGKADPTPSLFIDGKQFGITPNLYDALLHLYRANITCLWIDAVCINQKDNKEKSQQIQKMADIFRLAYEVIAWIGTHKHHSAALFQWIESHHPNGVIAENDAEITPKLQRALVKLAERPYWRRIWIIQEIAVARRVRVMCSDDFGDAVLISELCRYHAEGLDKNECNVAEPLLNMIQIRQFSLKGEQIGLLSLMRYTSSMFDSKYNRTTYRTFKSTKLIDQIYGLLGLAGDGKQFVPDPSYERTMNELFECMTRSIIKDSKRLDFAFLEVGEKAVTARQCGSTRSRSYKPAELPSWCPDYLNLLDSSTNSELTYAVNLGSKSSDHVDGIRQRYVERVRSWKATANSQLFDTNRWLEDGRLMSVEGLFVGKILPCQPFEKGLALSIAATEQENASRFAGLNHLLFTYSETPTPSLSDAIEAMSFVLGNNIDKHLCCDPWRSYFNRRIRECYPDELVWLAAILIMTELRDSSKLHGESWERIHRLSHTLTESVHRNYSGFQRKVAAYQPNNSAECVMNIVKSEGAYSWVPLIADSDDEIWLLKGCRMPMVLRRKSQSNGSDLSVFVKVGPAVVNGAMDGEMWSDSNLISISIA